MLDWLTAVSKAIQVSTLEMIHFHYLLISWKKIKFWSVWVLDGNARSK